MDFNPALDLLPGTETVLWNRIQDYRAATGGLPPALVAKALAAVRRAWLIGFTDDEIDALRRATFEVCQDGAK